MSVERIAKTNKRTRKFLAYYKVVRQQGLLSYILQDHCKTDSSELWNINKRSIQSNLMPFELKWKFYWKILTKYKLSDYTGLDIYVIHWRTDDLLKY